MIQQISGRYTKDGKLKSIMNVDFSINKLKSLAIDASRLATGSVDSNQYEDDLDLDGSLSSSSGDEPSSE